MLLENPFVSVQWNAFIHQNNQNPVKMNETARHTLEFRAAKSPASPGMAERAVTDRTVVTSWGKTGIGA